MFEFSTTWHSLAHKVHCCYVSKTSMIFSDQGRVAGGAGEAPTVAMGWSWWKDVTYQGSHHCEPWCDDKFSPSAPIVCCFCMCFLYNLAETLKKITWQTVSYVFSLTFTFVISDLENFFVYTSFTAITDFYVGSSMFLRGDFIHVQFYGEPVGVRLVRWPFWGLPKNFTNIEITHQIFIFSKKFPTETHRGY